MRSDVLFGDLIRGGIIKKFKSVKKRFCKASGISYLKLESFLRNEVPPKTRVDTLLRIATTLDLTPRKVFESFLYTYKSKLFSEGETKKGK